MSSSDQDLKSGEKHDSDLRGVKYAAGGATRPIPPSKFQANIKSQQHALVDASNFLFKTRTKRRHNASFRTKDPVGPVYNLASLREPPSRLCTTLRLSAVSESFKVELNVVMTRSTSLNSLRQPFNHPSADLILSHRRRSVIHQLCSFWRPRKRSIHL